MLRAKELRFCRRLEHVHADDLQAGLALRLRLLLDGRRLFITRPAPTCEEVEIDDLAMERFERKRFPVDRRSAVVGRRRTRGRDLGRTLRTAAAGGDDGDQRNRRESTRRTLTHNSDTPPREGRAPFVRPTRRRLKIGAARARIAGRGVAAL